MIFYNFFLVWGECGELAIIPDLTPGSVLRDQFWIVSGDYIQHQIKYT